MERVVFVSVHPDDETLGCGGTILKHSSNGDEIYWLNITNISISNGYSELEVKKKNEETQLVSTEYGFKKAFHLGLPPIILDTIPLSSIIQQIASIFNEIKPGIVYINHANDVHTDHQICFDAVYSCTKNFRFPFIKKVMCYETISETDHAAVNMRNNFNPNVFVDITDHFEKKCEIFKVYETEVMPDNLPRSISAIRSLSSYRGSRIGVKYAEAFQLLFERV